MRNLHFSFRSGRLTLFLLTVCFSLQHCKNHEPDQLAILDIENGIQNGSRPKLSDYCSSITYIPLETDSSSFVGEIRTDLLDITKDRLYMIDPVSAVCKVFDTTGKYRGNIGVKGNAPGEYPTISSFIIDQQYNYAVFMSFNKLVRYDLSGAFVDEFSLDSLKSKQDKGKILYGIRYAGDGKYYIGTINTAENQQSFTILNQAGDMLYTYTEPSNAGNIIVNTQGKSTIIRIASAYSYIYNNHLRFVSPNNDTVFSFSSNYEKTPAYVTRFGRYKTAPDGSNQSRAVSIRGGIVHETGNALFFRLSTGENTFSYNKRDSRSVSALYDKKSGNLSGITYDPVFDATGLVNDLDNGAPFWPARTIGNKMYQVISAINFIEYSQKSNSPVMKEIASHLTEESNPVIVVATVK